MLYVIVHTADIQDRDGAPDLLKAIRYRFPWLRYVFADGGYAGDKLRDALVGYGKRLCRSAAPMGGDGKGSGDAQHRWKAIGGRGTRLCVDRKVPPPRQRLGAIHLQLDRMGLYRQPPNPHPAARKILLGLINF
jgi:Transposase DDE domain